MGETDPTDAQLVAAAVAGGEDARSAYRQLVLRHQGWVMRYLRHILIDPGLADDAGQDTFLKAWVDLRRLRDPSQFKPWLRKIASRTAFNMRRASKRRTRYEGELDWPVPDSPADDRLAATQVLGGVLRELPYPYREVLVLRHVEDLSVREIASTLGVGESAAKMRLARARQAFYERYDAAVGDDDDSA